MRLLVTGAAGFIGANFVHYWTRAHPDDQLVAYDLLTYAGSETNLHHVRDSITFIRGDIGDQNKVEEVLIGSGREASVSELVCLILEALDKPASMVTSVPDRPGHDRRYLLDSGKLRRELGWPPLVEFETGIGDTIRWYADNRDWWAPLLERRAVDERDWEAARS